MKEGRIRQQPDPVRIELRRNVFIRSLTLKQDRKPKALAIEKAETKVSAFIMKIILVETVLCTFRIGVGCVP